MKAILLIISLITLSGATLVDAPDSDYPAYLIYDKNGKKVSFTKMLKTVYGSDVVFIGELHNNPISHWMELQLTKALAEQPKRNLILGAEMFESDNQLIMDEYLGGMITQQNFLNEMRLWPNYETDYKPVVEFAKANGIPLVATNVPRRYATLTFNKGFEALDSLTDQAKSFIAPLPIKYDPTINCYKQMLAMGGMHGGENMPKAQALKDATMAHFILKNLRDNSTFLHINGAYHSDNHEGIVWHLKDARQDLNIVTITTVLQDDVTKLMEQHEGKADFVLCVAADMTATH